MNQQDIFIQQITIEDNHPIFPALKVEIDHDISRTIITGKNGSGKTTLLNGLTKVLSEHQLFKGPFNVLIEKENRHSSLQTSKQSEKPSCKKSPMLTRQK